MNEMLSPNKMLEVERLTRVGPPKPLLQRIFRGETAPDRIFGTAGDIAPSGRERGN